MCRLDLPILILIFASFGCGVPEAPTTNPESVRAKKPAAEIDFDPLYKRVEAFKTHDLDYFAANWPAVRKDLHDAKNAGFAGFSKQQQERLWWSLEYLRGCRHPRILHDHGDDILSILFALDVPEHNKELRGILQHNR